MNPSTELRLHTMMRAMSTNIMPAIDPNNSRAQEHAEMLLGHMGAMLQQQGMEIEVNLMELDALVALATELVSLAEGGELTQARAEGVSRAIDEGDATALSLAVEQLIIATDASDAFKKASLRPILDYAGDAAVRGREWFKPMGF